MASSTILLAGAASSETSQTVVAKQSKAQAQQAVARFNDRIQRFTRTAWHWDDMLGRPHMRFSYKPGDSRSPAYVKWVLRQRQQTAHRLHLQVIRRMVSRIKLYKAGYARIQLENGKTVSTRQLAGSGSIELSFNQWRRKYRQAYSQWHQSGLFKAFSCIHRLEGSWNANTGNGYYGGLQANKPFQNQYGAEFVRRWGTADQWPVWAQITAAVRAYRSGRGFTPWPRTARSCGLL